ncbi:type III-A CRISPR-associated RAMP protein Csm3 [Kallotenue papyrolyticum]|uniref:type III-A CRISPR-associated RAMP protein Csm3 n=1 Tax=Kallotenue papyrolyticum TaxID=1325125 RepID=UPI0004923D8E|nr:type III-A CRISPR-associated RAMP protein Csm3 [Kallotenue papyrolyticum]
MSTAPNARLLHLKGRLFLSFNLRAVTGLHIGGSPGTLAIGNVDNPVIRDPLTGQPYIPGSSLRGKMRALMEKWLGRPQNNRIGQTTIHVCKQAQDYVSCELCRTFGIPGEYDHSETSRLIVRDAFLTPTSRQELANARTDLPYTEIKWEAAIDRVTSAATPRQLERVPAGAVFAGTLTFNLYNDADTDLRLFGRVLEAMQLLEEDYLGGQGARGSGQVRFEQLRLALRLNEQYEQQLQPFHQAAATLDELIQAWRKQLGS